ncbi:CPBP family intramembrane glutamic endopeptidase [Lysinibacillus sp. fls2-241-R2A-57]|uniref:CPBP family intramembrane glutamic endopeptidase n=1 Tax=Lysinibacillus sp. fls2-241-R2A-57 TaxID=3040292 RepID=UPI002557A701|nr:CPBP family intramembrane glutamic endopeptidase [Lysinibacillus sp. fls2-241-R2A-57]
MEVGFWVVIVFLLFYEPIIGYFGFQKFKKDVEIYEGARIKYYINTMIGIWIPTVFILLLVAFTDLSLQQIGLKMPRINTEVLGTWFTYIGLGIGIFYLSFVLYYILGYFLSDKIKRQLTEKKAEEWEKSEVSPIFPVSKKEKQLWGYVSITAGITEEIIYRGFLIFAFTYLFPDLSVWIVILLASILFGLAHTYQGFVMGVLRTTIFGVLFSILYIGLDSIIPLILFHFLLDYIVRLGDEKS